MTAFIGDHGVMLVDDKLAGDANFDNLVAAVRGVSTLPVLAVFNTHYHPDHIGNNDRFLAAGVMVIGVDGIDRLLASAKNGTKTPSILFTKDFSLVLMRGRIDAHHYRPGHTSADAIIHFPTAKTVSTGDLVVAANPTIDYAGGATIAGWIATLDEMLKLDFDTAIPGHGDAPLSRADVERFRAKLATFLDRARTAIRGGATKADLIARIRTEDLGWSWTATSWPAVRVDGLWAEAGGPK
ncbi:MBL fold metallo-hydrolase [Sphingomonas sp.]|uniref:MBL fold metallo-hydrolase n=1 Tax=Sphingomonas sp. TaxID=28214 RepID=UPI0025E479B5|nr:MBL fold metallo-hydrolase [Sphingomonas sp.]